MLVYLNGQIVPAHEARISPFDRGFLFADGVYEVVRAATLNGSSSPRLIGLQRHVRRLTRSLREARIDLDARELERVSHALLGVGDTNGQSPVADALIYFQVTRGTPDLSRDLPRSHLPPATLKPTVFAYARPVPALDLAAPPATKSCITRADPRWSRCDIKSIGLMGNVLALMDASQTGAQEVIFLRESMGRRTLAEGGLTNVMIVDRDGRLRTPRADSGSLLPGITREIVVELDPSIREEPVSDADLRDAREIMLLGTTAAVTSVTTLDGTPVGDGTPGPHAVRLNRLLADAIASGREDLARAPIPQPA